MILRRDILFQPRNSIQNQLDIFASIIETLSSLGIIDEILI